MDAYRDDPVLSRPPGDAVVSVANERITEYERFTVASSNNNGGLFGIGVFTVDRNRATEASFVVAWPW